MGDELTAPFRCELVVGIGYRLTATCHGELLEFRANEVVTAAHFDVGHCEAFRKAVMQCFGPGGPRTVPHEPYEWDVFPGDVESIARGERKREEPRGPRKHGGPREANRALRR